MLDHQPATTKNTYASEAPNPGDIISDCPGDFVGIRTCQEVVRKRPFAHTRLVSPWTPGKPQFFVCETVAKTM
jgi:hypothetical protein